MNFLKAASSLMVLSIILLSCEETPKNPVSEYGDSLINSYKKGQETGEMANLDVVNKAVQVYHAANGRYPKSLEEVKDLISSPVDLSKYDYDPQSGSVTMRE